MFDISFTEIMVIGIVALIVLGPERLPVVARTLGHLLGRGQRYVNQIKSDIKQEIELDEFRKLKISIEETSHTIHDSVQKETAGLKSLQEEITSLAIGSPSTPHTGHTLNTPEIHSEPAVMTDNSDTGAIPDSPSLQLDLGLEDTARK
jgi:sec-independent protein translocase protein TatB